MLKYSAWKCEQLHKKWVVIWIDEQLLENAIYQVQYPAGVCFFKCIFVLILQTTAPACILSPQSYKCRYKNAQLLSFCKPSKAEPQEKNMLMSHD